MKSVVMPWMIVVSVEPTMVVVLSWTMVVVVKVVLLAAVWPDNASVASMQKENSGHPPAVGEFGAQTSGYWTADRLAELLLEKTDGELVKLDEWSLGYEGAAT